MESLKNDCIEIAVDEHGAELQSLKKDGKEYLWQADARYWKRRSPVLFPLVGRVWGDSYRVDKREYFLGQHGFARDKDFTLVEASDSRLVYELRSSASTLEVYPFDFALRITYELEGSSVRVGWTVTNTGDRELPFQIGAHPAFNMPEFDPDAEPRAYFRFDTCGVLTFIMPKEKGCVAADSHQLVIPADCLMPIKRHTFDCDTYIFQDSQLRSVSLLKRDKSPCLTVSFSSPLVALWAPTASKPDCPFVCIEPWYGRCDEVGYLGEFTRRDVMNHLAPGEQFDASYTITIDE